VQIRATLSPSELKEAARISRPSRFWLRFFAANWYSTAICLLVVGIAINALLNHQDVRWEPMAGVFAFGAFFIWLSWFRWNAALDKAAGAISAKSAKVSWTVMAYEQPLLMAVRVSFLGPHFQHGRKERTSFF
jgi:arginine exporter protein ArgO